MSLLHQTVYEVSSKIIVRLPFTAELLAYHPNGFFPLLVDPIKACRAAIIGMLVLRPAWDSWSGPLNSFHSVGGWCYGLAGLQRFDLFDYRTGKKQN